MSERRKINRSGCAGTSDQCKPDPQGRRQIEGTTCQPMVPVVLNTSIADNPDSSSLIEVVFGTATIRFYGAVDPQNAQAVLSALR